MLFQLGCAASPDRITSTYVSPLEYYSYDCEQLRFELSRISSKVSEVSGIQKSEANKDAVAMGVGLVVFWPALFLLAGTDKQNELSNLKGRYDAVEETVIYKKCDYAPLLIQAKERKVELDREAEEKRKKNASWVTCRADAVPPCSK